jgi:hypothetical protein
MKKIVVIGVLLMFFLIGCKEKSKVRLSVQSNVQNDCLRDSLIGQWGELNSKPVWNIQKDSIYYFGRSIAYPYKIINHDFVIYFPDHSAVLRSIRVDNDTMFFFLKGDPLLVKAYRIKK